MLASGDVLSMSTMRESPARAFLWATATVFEDFVFEVCRAAMFKSGGVATKSSHILGKPLNRPRHGPKASIPTTPDVVVSLNAWAGLLDAKYKTLRAHPKSSDVYQVMAGGRLLDASAVALVYPAWRSFQQPRTWLLAGKGTRRICTHFRCT